MSTGSSAAVYNFDRLFQLRAVTMMALDLSFLPYYRDVIDPHYFNEYEDLLLISRTIVAYYDQYKIIPDRDTVIALMTESLTRNTKITENRRFQYFETLNEVYAQNLDHMGIVKDTVIPFGKRQNIKKALIDCALLADADIVRNHDAIVSKLMTAIQSGKGVQEAHVDFMESWESLPDRLYARENDSNTARLATGFADLDRDLKGGLGEKEIGFIEAQAGVGKSNCLVNFGAAAIMQKKNVLVVSNELYIEDWELRLAARMTGMDQDVISHPSYKDQFLELMERHRSTMSFAKIYYFPPYRLTPEGLRTLVSKTEHITGQKVDLLIIDYFKRMGGIDPRNPWNTESEVVKNIIGVLADHSTRCWTADQPNTFDRSIETMGLEHSGGSKSKAQDADVWITLNQSVQDEASKKAHFSVSKARRGIPQGKHDIFYDKSKCLMLPWETYVSLSL